MFRSSLRSALLAVAMVGSVVACKTNDTNSPESASSLKASDDPTAHCWRQAYGRPATVPTACPDSEKSGALCYPECRPGFKGVGPVCWQICEDGFTDDGAFCRRPSPLKIVAKESYGRTAGTLMQCSGGQEKDAGLCVDKCTAGYHGIGVVCWQDCPADFPVDCAAGCAKSARDCAAHVRDVFVAVLDTVTAAATKDPAGVAKGAAQTAAALVYDRCELPESAKPNN